MAKERVLTVSQQKLEDIINDHEDQGNLMVSFGLISQDEYDKITDQDEELRLKIEADPALAEVAAQEIEAGASRTQVLKDAGVQV